MSEQPLVVIYGSQHGQCALTGKETDCVVASIANSHIRKKLVSWPKLKETVRFLSNNDMTKLFQLPEEK